MLLRFETLEVIRKYGSSDFIEFPYCDMPMSSDIRSVVSVSNIRHRKNNSLYLGEYFEFSERYGHIFNCGYYSNMYSGVVDVCGINYYPPSVTDNIVSELKQEQSDDIRVLLDWPYSAKDHNGFYILGV